MSDDHYDIRSDIDRAFAQMRGIQARLDLLAKDCIRYQEFSDTVKRLDGQIADLRLLIGQAAESQEAIVLLVERLQAQIDALVELRRLDNILAGVNDERQK